MVYWYSEISSHRPNAFCNGGNKRSPHFCPWWRTFSGMILIFSSIVPIRLLRGVYFSMTNQMSSSFVLIMPVEANLVLRRLLERLCYVNFIDLPCASSECCLKLRSVSGRTMIPLNPILIVEIFDRWSIDGPLAICTLWLLSTMCPNGWRRLHTRPMTTKLWSSF